MQRHSDRLSTASGLGAIVLWSTTFAFARSLSEQVGPITAGAAVYGLGGLVCLGRVVSQPTRAARLLRLPRLYLLGCGSLFVLYPAAIYLAVGLSQDRTQLLEVALVNYLWPSLTVLLSLPLLDKRAGPWLVPATALALGGVFLVMTQGTSISWGSFRDHLQGNPAAYGLALFGAVAWAFYSNFARRWTQPGSDGAVDLFMPATGLGLLLIRLLHPEPALWTMRAVAEAVGLAAVTTISYSLWDRAMRRGNLLLVAACSYFTPLLSTAVSCLYLQVAPSPRLWIGCLLLIAGSILTWRSVSE